VTRLAAHPGHPDRHRPRPGHHRRPPTM